MSRPRLVVARAAHAADVARALAALGLWTTRVRAPGGASTTEAFFIEPGSAAVERETLTALVGVTEVLDAESPHPRVDAHGPTVRVGELVVGSAVVVAAGPCAVESETRIFAIAREVAAAGARVLRGGAFKPRTSPYSFTGRGREALGWLRRAADSHGLAVCTEVLDPRDVDDVAAVADLVQVGARSMQNGPLLRAIGGTGKPVLLKRAPHATVDEWLLAAEALLVAGASGVVWCERGGRADPTVRNGLDVAGVALLRHVHGLPAAVDPSHAAGRPDLLLPLARAGLAAGAGLVLVETHDRPGEALSDGPQALPLEALGAFVAALGGAPPAARIPFDRES